MATVASTRARSLAAPSANLHGRLQGRRLRAGQQALLERLLPRLAIDPNDPLGGPDAFAKGIVELRLEVGFGGGEHLIAQAVRQPHIGFLGCEPFRNGVVSLLHEVELTGVTNVRVHVGDAGDVIDRLPAAALSRIDILYPDPWPKRRQRKRRFVSAATLGRLARVLRPGATLRFVSDIDAYVGWTLQRVLASPDFTWPAATAADWLTPWPDWVQTRYEAKARREGRPSSYLTFIRR